MRKLLIGLSILVALIGLSQLYFYELEPEDYVISMTGNNAIDCGTVDICDDSTNSDNCAIKALSENKPFGVWYWIQGIDSKIGYGITLNEKGVLNAIEYDNYGILPVKVKHFYQVHKCSKPDLKLVLGKQRIDCEEAEFIHYVNEHPTSPAFCE